MAYQVDILDASLNYRATVRNLVPLNPEGMFLDYSTRLSNWGVAKFRVGKDDPLLASEGDILQPFRFHVRIKRFGVVIWQGVIVKNPTRNKNYIEVEARTYLYLLSRTLIAHDPADGNGAENFRTFNGATMASYISTLVTEAKATMGAPISTLTIGTVANPSFPADFKDSTGASLTGGWTFSPTFLLKVDYRDLLYVLNLFGAYSNSDFEITTGFVLNFESYIGNKQPNMVFSYGTYGNIEDYNAPLDGDAMANYLQGIAADNSNLIIHAEQSDAASITASGRIDGVAAFADVKTTSLLQQRLKQQLQQVKTADPELNFWVNERAYPLGQYGIGDVVTVQIKDGATNVNTLRRIVGLDCEVHQTGKERIRIITNKPRDDQ